MNEQQTRSHSSRDLRELFKQEKKGGKSARAEINRTASQQSLTSQPASYLCFCPYYFFITLFRLPYCFALFPSFPPFRPGIPFLSSPNHIPPTFLPSCNFLISSFKLFSFCGHTRQKRGRLVYDAGALLPNTAELLPCPPPPLELSFVHNSEGGKKKRSSRGSVGEKRRRFPLGAIRQGRQPS